ncbi:TPA: DNA transfer protein [Campylobacter fetus subsp. venerealis]|nr:DNA transfer protein [Campylobacter fetus subsp. venerealis]HDX6283987.1 DNA transfer protein [Campylobacter fetus subsp. venerealis]HDX6286092.1 DNA transfer protein [Campylobacter fetus subsp. venerealis]HDX6287834.1 DNA transfer protein [Campylobacter fetus subsp. venerealis]HDX6289828.1 DNA transfer protein [Campylobacter fetus subsp. venerealis]
MKKDKRIAIRLSEDEYEHIIQKAKGHGLTISRYLRDLAMNYPVICIVDQKAAIDMLKIAGDLGRLGGLFKHWLVGNEESKPNFSGKRTYKDIDEIVDEILNLQILLKEQAKKLMNDNKEDNI